MALLEGVSPGTKRWRRLEGTLAALRTLNAHCKQLLAIKGPGDDGTTAAAESSSREPPDRGGQIDGVLGQLGSDERGVASGILRCLVTASRQRISRTAKELAGCTGSDPDELAPVLDELLRLRVLRGSEPPPGETAPRFEILNDSVVDAILDWTSRHPSPRLRR
jgi:hypothetical protein